MAIANSPHRRAKLREIYAYIARRFPYYPRNKKDWRNMVRHNLSLRECFIKVPDKGRPLNNYWTVDPKYEAVFESGIFRRKQLWKQSVPSDTDGAGREDPPVEVAVASLSEPSVHRPIGDADLSAVTFPRDSGYGHRSTPTPEGTGSASYEERNLQSVVQDEAVMQQDKLTRSPSSHILTPGVICPDNSVCSTDDVSASDDGFSVFTCSSCLQGFSSKYRLTMHVFTHIDGVEPPSHVCTDCGEVFPSDDGLNKHLKMKDGGRTLIANPSADTRKVCSPSDVFDAKDRRPVSFEAVTDELVADIEYSQGQCCESGNCCLCQNKSKLLTTSFVHKKSYKCNACSKSFAFACYLQKRPVMDSGKEPHKCQVCGKLFPRVYDLKVHLLVHSGLKSLNCDVCGKLFATVDELQSHSAVHLEENPYKCDICGKSFPTPASLRSHAVAHSVVESHKCDDCGKLFARVGKFELHLSAHSRAGTFACSVCSKQFRSALTLKRHMKRHSYKKGPVALKNEQCPS